jgi:hypothetical protein
VHDAHSYTTHAGQLPPRCAAYWARARVLGEAAACGDGVLRLQEKEAAAAAAGLRTLVRRLGVMAMAAAPAPRACGASGDRRCVLTAAGAAVGVVVDVRGVLQRATGDHAGAAGPRPLRDAAGTAPTAAEVAGLRTLVRRLGVMAVAAGAAGAGAAGSRVGVSSPAAALAPHCAPCCARRDGNVWRSSVGLSAAVSRPHLGTPALVGLVGGGCVGLWVAAGGVAAFAA